jgi:hypothetical protein
VIYPASYVVINIVSFCDTVIGENVNVVGAPIELANVCWSTPFLYRSDDRVRPVEALATNLNVIDPTGDPLELNVNTPDLDVKAGVLVNPLTLLIVVGPPGVC